MMGWFGGGIMMLLFWGLIIWFVIYLVRGKGHHMCGHDGHKESKSSLDILKERYAKGEINKDQFESMKKDIS